MIPQTERYRELARENLNNLSQRQLAGQIAILFRMLRGLALQSYEDPAGAMREAAAIRERSLAQLPALLEQFETNATAAGASVHWARSGEEANHLITDLLKTRGITMAVKGKSMVSEETGLNHALEEAGIEVYEGDLGEFIIQQKHMAPFHIVAPAVHMPVHEISDLFVNLMGIEPSDSPEQLGRAARNYLREKFACAGAGITGVNVAVAETGSILLVENEGNIRMATSSPRIHIALMSIEKVVATVDEAFKVTDLLIKNCTGQKISSYISMLTGPRRKDQIDGPQEMHIIILDNGRSRIYEDDELRDALRCIRCGACLGVCPVYTRIGGPAYGWVYSGPMGAVLNPLLLGISRSADLFQACTQCGACQAACPAGINHPQMYHRYRRMMLKGDPVFKASKTGSHKSLGLKIWSWGMRSSWRYQTGGALVRFFLKMKSRQGSIKNIKVLPGWFQHRNLPAPSAQTFRKWWDAQNKRPGMEIDSGGGQNHGI